MSRRGASNWRDNTASQNMFLNIFFVHHNSTAAAEHGSDFRNPGERSVTFFQSNGPRHVPKGVPKLTVEAFAHGGGRGHEGGFGHGGHMNGLGGARIGSGQVGP